MYDETLLLLNCLQNLLSIWQQRFYGSYGSSKSSYLNGYGLNYWCLGPRTYLVGCPGYLAVKIDGFTFFIVILFVLVILNFHLQDSMVKRIL